MVNQTTLTLDSFSGMTIGERLIFKDSVTYKWWVRLWYFITFRTLPSHVEHKYIVKAVLNNTVTIAPLVMDYPITYVSGKNPEQPNFVRFQNNTFKRRGR